MLGVALGFGGSVIRTVSFLGCTFAASAALGGTEPGGGVGAGAGLGVFSDITWTPGAYEVVRWCQPVNREAEQFYSSDSKPVAKQKRET